MVLGTYSNNFFNHGNYSFCVVSHVKETSNESSVIYSVGTMNSKSQRNKSSPLVLGVG